MNVKSKILKLSILMLVLVLIPAVAAEDTSESFYIEYAESEDVIVEEAYSIENVEYACEDTSDNDIGEVEYDHEDLKTSEVEEVHEDLSAPENHFIEDDNDAVFIEPEEGSFDVTHNVQENDDVQYISNENTEIIDVDEFEEDDLTIEDVSVINQASFFISKHSYNFKVIIMIEELVMETAFKTSSFKRSSSKILELKNNILINQDVEIILGNDLIAIVDGNMIVCINKILSDYIFSIDNSVIGDGNMIFIYNSCFLKFDSCFNAFIFCDLLTFEHFFVSDFSIASKLFLNFAVEYDNPVSLSDKTIYGLNN